MVVVDVVTMAISADERLGLRAIGALDGSAADDDLVHELFRDGLVARLELHGLHWAPSAEPSVRSAGHRHASWWKTRPMAALVPVLVILGLVVLIGGYAGRWRWTGFTDNGQLWDWLQLLVLPVAFATLPLWLKHAEFMSAARRAGYAAVVAAFAVFVALGYTVPIGWTGFRGNRLWDWLTLILLPATLIIVGTWAATNRPVLTRHRIAIAGLGVAGVVAVIGGYDWHWTWTGFQGNTLWDWLQLLLLPLVFPTILAPAVARFLTGDAERRAQLAAGRTGS